MILQFATTNINKYKEAISVLPFTVKQLVIDIPEVQGTSDEIAYEKAK